MKKRQRQKNYKEKLMKDKTKKLLLESCAINENQEDKDFWLDRLPYMTVKKVKKLFNLLLNEKEANKMLDIFFDNPFPSYEKDIRDILPDQDKICHKSYLIDNIQNLIINSEIIDHEEKTKYLNKILDMEYEELVKLQNILTSQERRHSPLSKYKRYN